MCEIPTSHSFTEIVIRLRLVDPFHKIVVSFHLSLQNIEPADQKDHLTAEKVFLPRASPVADEKLHDPNGRICNPGGWDSFLYILCLPAGKCAVFFIRYESLRIFPSFFIRGLLTDSGRRPRYAGPPLTERRGDREIMHPARGSAFPMRFGKRKSPSVTKRKAMLMRYLGNLPFHGRQRPAPQGQKNPPRREKAAAAVCDRFSVCNKIEFADQRQESRLALPGADETHDGPDKAHDHADAGGNPPEERDDGHHAAGQIE